MKYPKLVPHKICHTDIEIHLEGRKLTMGGTAEEIAVLRRKCNYQEKQKHTLDAERRLVTIEATALFDGDIASIEELRGYCIVNGLKRRIYRAARGRNPDGSVNYTRLELV